MTAAPRVVTGGIETTFGEGMRLRVTPKPEPDESLIGYLLRLAERNGYETATVILLLAGFDVNALRNCQFAFRGQDDLSPLSLLTGCSVQMLACLRYAPAPSETTAYRYLIFGKPVQRYFINARRPKVCPECLRESAYCRKVWELAPVTACPRHSRMLLDECPGCRARVSWIRSSVSVCPCGFDWREASPCPVAPSEPSVAGRVHRLCNLPSGGNASGVTAGASPLDKLDLEHSLSALSFVAAQRVGLIDTTGKFSVKGRSNAELHELFTRAEAVFESWPANFEDFLDWRRARPNDSASSTGLHKDFGTLYHGLYFNLPDAAFDFIRGAFEEYVGRRWSGGYAGVIKRRKGVVLKDRKYTTKTEARNRLRVDPSYIDRLVETGRLNALVQTRGKRRMYLIELASLEKLELEFQESLTVEEAAEMLNIGVTAIPDLIRYQCLTPHRGPDVDGLPFWKFTKEAINELLNSLESRVSQESNQSATDDVDFSTALRALSRRHYSVGSFLRAILDGKISPCVRRGGAGVKSLVFSKVNIKTLCVVGGHHER